MTDITAEMDDVAKDLAPLGGARTAAMEAALLDVDLGYSENWGWGIKHRDVLRSIVTKETSEWLDDLAERRGGL